MNGSSRALFWEELFSGIMLIKQQQRSKNRRKEQRMGKANTKVKEKHSKHFILILNLRFRRGSGGHFSDFVMNGSSRAPGQVAHSDDFFSERVKSRARLDPCITVFGIAAVFVEI